MLDVFLQNLILQLFDLFLSPEHRQVTDIDDLKVRVPEGVLILENLVKNKGRKHQVLRIIVLLEDFRVFLNNVGNGRSHYCGFSNN
jgi:hypothetical protein